LFLAAALSFIVRLPLSFTLPALDNFPLLLLIVFVSRLILWESMAEAGLEDNSWWGVCQQKTNLPVSPPAAHCCCLLSSAAAIVVHDKICYEMAETGVRSWRLIGGHDRKRLLTLLSAAILCGCLWSSTKPPSLLLLSTVVTLCCPPPSVKGQQWVVRLTFVVSRCRRRRRRLSMISVARLTFVITRCWLLIILSLSAAHFCYRSLTAANHSCQLQRSGVRK
jgi:hypothetical protein